MPGRNLKFARRYIIWRGALLDEKRRVSPPQLLDIKSWFVHRFIEAGHELFNLRINRNTSSKFDTYGLPPAQRLETLSEQSSPSRRGPMESRIKQVAAQTTHAVVRLHAQR